VVRAVVERFGPDVVGSGGVDRGALAGIVFADQRALADLERLLHEPVVAACRAWLAGVRAELAVLEAVKLVESGLHRDVDEVWLVVCDRAIMEERLLARGWSAAEIARRLAAGPDAERLAAVADVIVDNGGSPAATRRQLRAALAASRRRHAASTAGEGQR